MRSALRPPALGNGTAATGVDCGRCAARRKAVRARSWAAEGFAAAGRWRATGASTVTGGRLDCWASAPENDATAIRPATAVTVLPELFSMDWLTDLIAVSKRSDFGAFILFMTRAPEKNVGSCAFLSRGDPSHGGAIERGNSGQCDRGNTRK